MSTTRPLLLDLYCGQGGAGKGYHDAGFEIVGVDLHPQPRYPFRFLQGDVLDVLREGVSEYAAFHASPPCQLDSATWRINGREQPDLIAATRDLLLRLDVPYVIENVEGALPKLRDPVMLCAAMFGRAPTPDRPGLDRHRFFETNWALSVPEHPAHTWRTTKMGRAPRPGEAMHVVGNFHSPHVARELMAMPWANRDGLREAIPPYYTEHIGRQLMQVIA